jgi:hypothetical protein
MRVIKLGLISLVAFALLITLLSLFFPSHVRISKAIDVNTSRDSIISAISNIENWKKWYPGADTMDLIGHEGRSSLRSRGSNQEITISSASDSTITATLSGESARKAENGWNIYGSQVPNTYTIQWYMDIHLGWYPWEKFSGLLLEKRYGPSMEKGLDRLKKFLEGRSPNK